LVQRSLGARRAGVRADVCPLGAVPLLSPAAGLLRALVCEPPAALGRALGGRLAASPQFGLQRERGDSRARAPPHLPAPVHPRELSARRHAIHAARAELRLPPVRAAEPP